MRCRKAGVPTTLSVPCTSTVTELAIVTINSSFFLTSNYINQPNQQIGQRAYTMVGAACNAQATSPKGLGKKALRALQQSRDINSQLGTQPLCLDVLGRVDIAVPDLWEGRVSHGHIKK